MNGTREHKHPLGDPQELIHAWEVWGALKNLLSCSPNSPCASFTRFTYSLKLHEPILYYTMLDKKGELTRITLRRFYSYFILSHSSLFDLSLYYSLFGATFVDSLPSHSQRALVELLYIDDSSKQLDFQPRFISTRGRGILSNQVNRPVWRVLRLHLASSFYYFFR